jgi:hypothetical protein
VAPAVETAALNDDSKPEEAEEDEGVAEMELDEEEDMDPLLAIGADMAFEDNAEDPYIDPNVDSNDSELDDVIIGPGKSKQCFQRYKLFFLLFLVILYLFFFFFFFFFCFFFFFFSNLNLVHSFSSFLSLLQAISSSAARARKMKRLRCPCIFTTMNWSNCMYITT